MLQESGRGCRQVACFSEIDLTISKITPYPSETKKKQQNTCVCAHTSVCLCVCVRMCTCIVPTERSRDPEPECSHWRLEVIFKLMGMRV